MKTSKINILIKKCANGTIWTSIYNHLYKNRYFLSENNVVKKQEKELKRKLKRVVRHVPYYKDIEDPTDITCFPIVDRHIITDNFDSFIADNKDKYLYNDAYTGGSTGEPFHLLASGGFEAEFGLKRWKYLGYKEGDKILDVGGVSVEEELRKKRIFWRKTFDNEIPFGTMSLSSLYISEDTEEEYIEFLNGYEPSFLWGYVSSVYELACMLERRNITLSKPIKAIVMTSEIALSYQIDKIKEVFKTNVYFQYGHTESCINAYTYDETYRYRVEPLYGYVEILDENGVHVKEGEVGEVVVTSLHNNVMPLVRYRTCDYAEYGGKDDRYIYLNKVLGRTQDVFYNRNGQRTLLTGIIFGLHKKALGHIYRWQIEQIKAGEINIHIIKGENYSDEDEKEIINLFDVEGNVDVVIDYVDDIPLTKRGKNRLLVQHLDV